MNKEFRARINVDLDGVIDPFGDNLRWFIGEREGVPAEEVEVPAWGTKRGKFDAWWRKGVASGAIWGTNRPTKPIEGAREFMWKLSDDEYFIRIVTLRLVQSWNHAKIITNTVQWLDRENIPYREISFIGPGTEKSDFHADFAIDDRPKHAEEYMEKGIKGYLLTQPWNADSDTLAPRTDDWEDFYYKVTRQS